MNLKIFLPTEVFMEKKIKRAVAEAGEGHFGILPDHIDYITSLVPGIMTIETEDGEEEYIAVDEGVLVKTGEDLLISVWEAVSGDDLETLEDTVKDKYLSMGEEEKKARGAAARLESDLVRKFMDL